MKIQTGLRLLFPPRCLGCDARVESDFGLCGPCWRDTPFIGGLTCDACGAPLLGDFHTPDAYCDGCLGKPPVWSAGRAALLYHGTGRRLVLALKHGDRHDIVRPAATWMARIGKDIIADSDLIAPVPLHWSRLLKRRFNQSALLGRGVANLADLPFHPDLLCRRKRTMLLGNLPAVARTEILSGAIAVPAGRRDAIAGRRVLLVDDVMTSGATLTACATACLGAGAKEVRVLILARAAKDA